MISEAANDVLGFILDIDLRILHGLSSSFGNPALDEFVVFVCGSKLLRGTLPIALFWFFWFAPGRKTVEVYRAILVKGVVASLAAIIAARAIAFALPLRLRPFVDPAAGIHSFFPVANGDFEDWSAFPSDTAAFEFALAWSLMRISPAASVWLMVYGFVVACLPRIVVGIHFPSDILAGIVIGIVTAASMQKFRMPRFIGSKVLTWDSRHPIFYALAFALTCELAQIFENVRLARKAFVHMWRIAGSAVDFLPIVCAASLLLVLIGAGALVLRHVVRGMTESSRSDNQTAPVPAQPRAPFRVDKVPTVSA